MSNPGSAGAGRDGKLRHGRDCPKVPHLGEGYLHGADDDSFYDVDGVSYCGRCHGWMGDAVPDPLASSSETQGEQDRFYALRDAVTMYAGDGIISDDAVISMATEHATMAARCTCAASSVPVRASGEPQQDYWSRKENMPTPPLPTHGLERTSPKGGPFLGRCVYCGQQDLPMKAALERCDKAPDQSQQVLDALAASASSSDDGARQPIMNRDGQVCGYIEPAASDDGAAK